MRLDDITRIDGKAFCHFDQRGGRYYLNTFQEKRITILNKNKTAKYIKDVI